LKLVVLAVGKLRDKQFAALCDEYLSRARRHLPIDVVEVDLEGWTFGRPEAGRARSRRIRPDRRQRFRLCQKQDLVIGTGWLHRRRRWCEWAWDGVRRGIPAADGQLPRVVGCIALFDRGRDIDDGEAKDRRRRLARWR